MAQGIFLGKGSPHATGCPKHSVSYAQRAGAGRPGRPDAAHDAAPDARRGGNDNNNDNDNNDNNNYF